MSQDYQYGDYNRGGMIAFTFSMVVTLVFFVYVAFIHSGVDLKEIPKSESVTAESDTEQQAADAEEEATEAETESAEEGAEVPE